MKAGMKPDDNLRTILPVHLGSDERETHVYTRSYLAVIPCLRLSFFKLDMLAKETVLAFVQHLQIQLPGGSVYNGDVVHGKVH